MELVRLPKVALHCHLDGILDPPMLRQLQGQGIQLPLDPDVLARAYPLRGYADFQACCRLVGPTEGDLERFKPILALHVERLLAQNVVYTELMIGPSEIPRQRRELLPRVREFRAYADSLEQGRIQLELLVALNRRRSPEEVAELAERALLLYEAGLVVGVAVAGPEQGHPVQPLQATLARLQEAGLGIEIHAGEWSGPESVWDALRYGSPQRIGHAVSLYADPVLLRLVQEQNLHLELCPTSNLRTGSVANLAEHPVRRTRQLGLSFSINTDDPGAFECSMQSEYQLPADSFGFQEHDFTRICTDALAARFQPALRIQAP